MGYLSDGLVQLLMPSKAPNHSCFWYLHFVYSTDLWVVKTKHTANTIFSKSGLEFVWSDENLQPPAVQCQPSLLKGLYVHIHRNVLIHVNPQVQLFRKIQALLRPHGAAAAEVEHMSGPNQLLKVGLQCRISLTLAR